MSKKFIGQPVMPKELSEGALGIDSHCPWNLTRREWNWPPYRYRISLKKWRKLLARAKRGDSEAGWQVADMYGDGCKDRSGKIIVKRSPIQSARWFRSAAEQGCAPAQNTLGVLLSDGEGVGKNVGEALLWLKKAFHAKESCAAQNIAITYRQIGQLRTAVKWFQKSVEAGDGDALVQLGIHLFWGKGARKDSKAAVRCFRAATKSNNISEVGRDDAFFLLGLAHYQGAGVKKSVSKATQLLRRANKDSDNPSASRLLRKLQIKQLA